MGKTLNTLNANANPEREAALALLRIESLLTELVGLARWACADQYQRHLEANQDQPILADPTQQR